MPTMQTPLACPFGPRSTAAEVMAGHDLTGRTAIVTGGASGLGWVAVRALAQAGARVVAGVRNPSTARSAMEGVRGVELEELDLADLRNVQGFAGRFLASGRTADIVILNAGIMACPETRTATGWELQLAVNHLGHFALVHRLWPALARGSRVVSVSSGAHRNCAMRWDDLHFATGYDKWRAYGQSKTANVLLALHLDRIGRQAGIRAYAVHPGNILSPLQRFLSRREMVDAGWVDESGKLRDPTFKTPEQGAATHLWAATSPLLEDRGGVYCEDCNIAALSPDAAADSGVARHAVDPEEAARLWTLSAQMTGVPLAPGGSTHRS